MSFSSSWAVVVALAVGTFLIRYSFIGLFAKRDMPVWLDRCLKLMVPAIFSAIVASGMAIAAGHFAGWANWPRYVAAALAFVVARYTQGNMLWTVLSGMAALHLCLQLSARLAM